MRLPAVQGCRVDYFDGNVFVSAGISVDSVDGHQVDCVARQHVGVDSVVEIIDRAVERSQNAAFGEKFDVACERTNVVVVVVHSLSRTECNSLSLRETGVESVEKVSFAVAAMDVAVTNHNVVRVGEFVNAVLSKSQQIDAKVAPSDDVFRRKSVLSKAKIFCQLKALKRLKNVLSHNGLSNHVLWIASFNDRSALARVARENDCKAAPRCCRVVHLAKSALNTRQHIVAQTEHVVDDNHFGLH